MVALVGDPGSGKSHLLWWLKRQHRPESLVVSIPALPDLAQPFRFTLKQLVSGLCRVDKKGAVLERPIDRLLWEVIYTQTYDLLDAARVGMYQGPTAVLKQLGPLCLDGGRKRALADFAEAAQKVWPQIEPGLRSYLLTLPTENSLDATARQVMVQFPYADRRALVTAWLAGEDLAQKDRERIGAKQTINQEATARYVLCSLIRLASVRRPSSVTIVFDQADQLLGQLGQPGLHALADVLGSLHGLSAATLLILSCRPDTFGQFSEKQARPGPSQIKQSMELISLARVSPPMLREVVTARLKSVSGSSTSGLAPLSESDLGFLHEVDTPRAAMTRLATVYTERAHAGTTAAKPVADAKAAPSAKIPASSKPALAKVESAKVEAVAKSTDATKPVSVKSVTGVASAAKPATDKKAEPVAKSAVKSAAKSSDSATTPVRSHAADAGDALAAAMVEAQAGKISVEQQRSLTHIDKSGPTVQREGKSSQASVAAASKQRDGAAPVSRADSGDTVRRVPDESLLAKTRDAVLKSGPAKAVEPGAAKTTAAPAKSAQVAAVPAKAATPAQKPATTPAPVEKATPAAKATSASVKAVTPTEKPAEKPAPAASKKPEPVAKPEPARAPSADTPSRAWLDMAGENDPLAEAIAAARAELGPSLSAEPAKPIKARPVEPLPKGAAKLIPTDFEPTRQIVVPVGEKGGFPDFAALSEPSKTEMSTAPSAESPSVSWLAMAAEEDPFGASEPAAAKPAARPVRGTAAMGVVVVKPAAAKAATQGVGGPVAAPRSGGRSTQARIAAVPVPSGGTISPQRILATLDGRSSMAEWQLAEELGVSIDNLSDHLNRMAANGQVRLVPSEDGRMVVPL